MTPSDEPTDPLVTARREMIRSQIVARGVRDPRVLAAMQFVPRHCFVAQPRLAYADQAVPIDEGQTISQPYIVAYMTAALRVDAGHKVLEVGTGTGYQAAVLSRLTDHLHTIERSASLSGVARRRLAELGIAGVRFHVGDGSLGLGEEAPFDRILVTAAAPSVPPALVDQLAENGLIVAPVGGASEQMLVCVTRSGGRTIERNLIRCRFVKLIGRQGWS